jgi:fibronectin type 3 domain-containing protein
MTYQVYRSTISGGPYTEIASSIAATNTTPSYVDTTISAGTTYYYVVAATDTTGQSGYSTQISATTTPVPSSPSATGGSEQVTVSWTGTYGINYNIYAASSSSGTWTTVKSNIKGTNGSMNYTDTLGPTGFGLQSGQTYYYAVAAVTGPNDLSETDSASVSAAPSGDPLGPIPTVSSVTTSGSSATVSLSWTIVPGATGYNIVRSTSTTGPWTCPASNCLLSTPQTGTTYVDSGAASGTIEYYQILATNNGGSSYGTSNTIGVSTSITTASFATTGTGTSNKAAASWSFDLKQNESSGNINTYVANAGGASMFTGVRVAWYPQYPLLLSNGALDPIAQSQLDYEAANASLVEHTSGTFLNFFLSPKTGNLDTAFYDSSTPPAIDVTKWVDAMQLSRDYYKTTYSANNANIAYNGIENEPDNTGCQFTSSTFGTILNALDGNWGSAVQEGPDTFRAGNGALWLGANPSSIQAPQPMGGGSLCETTYTPIQNSTPNAITKASTHVIGGTPLADFKTFLTQARDTDGLAIWLPEIHTLAEPLVALNYGTAKGIARAVWWNPITTIRGDFMQISKANNQLFNAFAADGLFAVTSGYFNGSNTLAVFLANAAVDPTTFKVPIYETFILKCTNRSVYFNGSSTATSTFTMTLPSADNQNAEFEIPVTW